MNDKRYHPWIRFKVTFNDLMNASLQSGYPLKSVSHTPVMICFAPICLAKTPAKDKNNKFLPGTKVEGNSPSTPSFTSISFLVKAFGAN